MSGADRQAIGQSADRECADQNADKGEAQAEAQMQIGADIGKGAERAAVFQEREHNDCARPG